jgi:hypothetical protein
MQPETMLRKGNTQLAQARVRCDGFEKRRIADQGIFP